VSSGSHDLQLTVAADGGINAFDTMYVFGKGGD
jgi:hypothetical protein